MKMSRLLVATVVALSFAALLPVSSATAGKSGKRSIRGFDPSTVETVRGEVVSVEKVPAPRKDGYGIRLVLRTGKETLTVRLGPEWYVESQGFSLAPNDSLEIRGSKLSRNGRPVLVASEVRKGDRVLTLRDESGTPAWGGQKQRAD